ncbi:MAG: hypothetical protein EB032_06045 [Betaproteobacteria bacterium]|nr:hypothetical protein [Betaproteobacteria bacterium]
MLEPLSAARGKLRHQSVVIAVHHQARQSIRLTMHQAHAIALNVKQTARLHRCVNQPFNEGCVNALRFIKTPNPGADARGGTERSPRQKNTFV